MSTDGTKPDIVAFLESLVKAGKLALTADSAKALARLEPLLDEPEALYEELLDSPEVDEIFLSDEEFVDKLGAYLRR